MLTPEVQNILVGLILIACVAYVVNALRCFFINGRGRSNKCDRCSGCALKDLSTRR